MRFFERPGGFVEIIIPQSVQKEKRQTRKPAAFELPEQEDLVSAWINTLPSVDINDEPSLGTHFSDEAILLIE